PKSECRNPKQTRTPGSHALRGNPLLRTLRVKAPPAYGRSLCLDAERPSQAVPPPRVGTRGEGVKKKISAPGAIRGIFCPFRAPVKSANLPPCGKPTIRSNHGNSANAGRGAARPGRPASAVGQPNKEGAASARRSSEREETMSYSLCLLT